jgi:ADP-ribose pyrophosphatase
MRTVIEWTGKHLRLMRRGHWEYVERIHATGAVVIAAVTEEGKLVLTEQFRPPVDRNVIELPAGLAGDVAEMEDLTAAARRELSEETGYTADQMLQVSAAPPSAGLSSETVTVFQAMGLRQTGPGGGDAHENIQIHEVPLPTVDEWLEAKRAEGMLIDPKVYVGLYFLGCSRRKT